MCDHLFPKTANNDYQGYAIAKWVFFFIIIMTVVRSLLHMFLPDSGAHSIATIPLDTFTPSGAASTVLMLALWGSAQLMMAIVYIVVAWRYRNLIPFMYVLLFLEYSFRMLLMHIKPVHITGTAPGHVLDYVMIPLALIMCYLALPKAKAER